jgi:hypothetical protein
MTMPIKNPCLLNKSKYFCALYMRTLNDMNKKTQPTGKLKTIALMLLLTILILPDSRAQTLTVGMPYFEDALRRGQLMGKINPDVSFLIRPVDPVRAMGIDNPFGTDTLLFPLDSNSYFKFTDLRYKMDYTRQSGLVFNKNTPGSKSNIRISLLPVYLHTRYNHHHPYGWSDGPMVPARGLQQYISGGIYIRASIFEAQFRPEYVWAQNREFQNPPFRPRQIHMPERMGQEAYTFSHLGQSFVKIHLGPIAVGYSNENIWWGPGRKNAIAMSNNAPGFRHFTLHTNKPIQTPYGTIEGQMVAGKLRYSGFTYPLRYTPGEWPPVAGDVVPDTVNGDGYYGYTTSMAVVFQPKWTPGLFLGASRIVQVKDLPNGFKDYLRILYLEPRGEQTGQGPDEGAINRNQIATVFMRYLFKEAHAELYFEIGREDFWFDLEDLMTRLQYSTVYMAGFRKMYELRKSNTWLELMGEYTKIQAPFGNLVRSGTAGYSFYTHGNQVGWTNRGQVLGAGIGPGSNMITFGGTWYQGFNSFGVHFERVAYNEDMFYTAIDYLRLGSGANPFFVDASKHFVDWSFLLNYHTSYGKLMVGYQLQLLRTYNFQWNYDPYSTQGLFRYPGINVWSLNGELSMVYRF